MAFSTDPDPLNRTRTRRLLFPTFMAWSFSYKSIEEVACAAVRVVRACRRRDLRSPVFCVVASGVPAGRGASWMASGFLNLTACGFLFSRVLSADAGAGIVMGIVSGRRFAPISAVFRLLWWEASLG